MLLINMCLKKNIKNLIFNLLKQSIYDILNLMVSKVTVYIIWSLEKFLSVEMSFLMKMLYCQIWYMVLS
jgi:hypothetical protein